MEKGLVTVIVPVYKTEKYLDRCVESIVNQTYRNLEIILVDDGSPDNCPQMCDAWAQKDPRIRVIHKKNAGLSSARNDGIEQANGVYLVFIDSDDYILLDHIKDLFQVAEKYRVDLVISELQCVNEQGKLLSKCGNNGNVEMLSTADTLKRMLEGNAVSMSACAKLYSKKLFYNIRFPEGRLYEDIATVYKIIMLCDQTAMLNTSSYFYVYREASIGRREFDVRTMDMLYMTEMMLREVLSAYPELLQEGYVNLFSMCVNLLCQMDNIKDYDYYVKVQKRVYFLRKTVLLCKRVSIKQRVFALISFLGEDTLYYFIQNIFIPIRNYIKK